MDARLRLLSESTFTFANPYQDVRGWMVKDTNGTDLGHLEDVLIDEAAEKVRFLKVAHGGILGFGVSHSFIPIEEVTAVAHGQITVATPAEKVAAAPRFDPELVDTSQHLENLYNYYGHKARSAPMPVARVPGADRAFSVRRAQRRMSGSVHR
jgi:sporulation protein YlmC with PRC-barrel domain